MRTLPKTLPDFPERLYRAQIKMWETKRKRRLRELSPVQSEISRRVAEYRKSSKRSQEMNFKNEEWHKELKEKEKILHSKVVESANKIKQLGKKIDSLHRPKRVPYTTPRRPKKRG